MLIIETPSLFFLTGSPPKLLIIIQPKEGVCCGSFALDKQCHFY
jgi:hypothetical protein